MSKQKFHTESKPGLDTGKLKIKLKTKNFNEKVRKANKKTLKRRSRDRRASSKGANEHGKHNNSQTSLKSKLKRRLSKPHKTIEKTKCESSEDENAMPTREIGLDFLEFMPKKKQNANMSKLFNSTHKNFNNESKGWLDKPSKNKIRPNSAQNMNNSSKIPYTIESPSSPNEDLDSPIKPINELPEGPGTNKESDASNLIDDYRSPCPLVISSNHDKSDGNPSTQRTHLHNLEPVYSPEGKFWFV